MSEVPLYSCTALGGYAMVMPRSIVPPLGRYVS